MKVDCKVVLLGSANVGKTCLIRRIHKGIYRGEYENTIGAAFCAKRINLDGHSVTLGIWDTAGSEKFESIARQYTRDCNAAIICYDVTDRLSFDRAKQWVATIQRDEPDCSVYFTGTKCDLPDHVVSLDMGSEFARMENCQHFMTSSKENLKVSELFYKISLDSTRAFEVLPRGSARQIETIELSQPRRRRDTIDCWVLGTMEPVLETWSNFAYKAGDIFHSYYELPFYHLIVEIALVLFIIKILMSKSTGSPGEESPLTEREIEKLITEWVPEPLVPVDALEKDPVTPVIQSKVGKFVTVDGVECLNLATMNFLGMIGKQEIEREI
eukprot:sb/3466721/